MSNITLYMIPGISRLDTPTFSTLTEQRYFFASAQNYPVLNDSFYVPHFQDEIVLLFEDLNFKKAYNYLKLEFNDKEYYYFIDAVRYISEDSLAIKITMDVIQTYMFNIKFLSSELDRLSIKRWVSGKINRDYVRENFSNGIFKSVVQKGFPGSLAQYEPYYVVLFKCLQNDNYGIDTNGNMNFQTVPYKETHFNGNSKDIIDGAYYVAMPLDKQNREVIYEGTSVNNVVYSVGGSLNFIRNFQESANVVDCVIVPGYVLREFGISVEATTTSVTFRSNKQQAVNLAWYDTGGQTPGFRHYSQGFLLGRDLSTTDNTYKVDLPTVSQIIYPENFVVGTPDTAFNYRLVPQLLDDNYIKVKFGLPSGYTTFPLYALNDRGLALNYTYNVPQFSTSFWCTPTDTTIDDYWTYVENRCYEGLPLYNDAYKQYISQNRSSLTRGIDLAYKQELWSFARSEMNAIAKGVPGVMSFDGASNIQTLNQLAVNTGDSLMRIYSIGENLAIRYENLQFTPDTQKTGNSALADYINDIIVPQYKIERVENIEGCAEVYESSGYRVHHITTDNLLEIRNRFYYDIVKTSNINIYLDVLNDEATLSRIKERFNNGLRIWHTDSGTLLCRYNTYGTSFHMGQVCLYDNTEV